MEPKADAIRGWEWLGVTLATGAFAAIRAPLFAMPGLLLGWNSDAALFGLMARAMRDGVDVPVFFWGQFYLGTLTSLLTAALSLVLQAPIGPLLLRAGTSVEVWLAALLFWLGLRRTFGRAAAMLATFWLAAGPAFFFHFTIAPIGAEQLFLIAALVFWYSTRASFEHRSEWFVLGMLCGFGMWLHQGVMFLAAAVGVALLAARLLTAGRAAIALAGAAVGYLPAAVSLLREDLVLYSRALLGWNLWRLADNFADTMRSDLWLLLGDDTITGVAIGMVLLLFAALGLRRVEKSRERTIVLWTLLFSAAFWTLTTYPYPGAVRYIVPVVPLVYGAAARGMLTLRWKAATALAAIVVALGLYVPRAGQVGDVVAARSELYTNWPGSFDPRPTLAGLRRGGYRVCYGEVWVAHKLEWLTRPTVRFVPVHSVHRTLPMSLGLIRTPGRKCYVDNDGRVKPLTPAEEQYWASTVIERARKAGL